MTCQWSEGKKEIVFTTVWEEPRTTGRMLSQLALEPEDRTRGMGALVKRIGCKGFVCVGEF